MRSETGAAHIEAVILSLVLLIPTMWLLTVLADVHRAALATSAAARDAGEDVAANPLARTDAGVDWAVETSLTNHGLVPREARVRLARDDDRVELRVSYPVPVVRLPFLRSSSGPVIWVRGEHASRIDPYRSDR